MSGGLIPMKLKPCPFCKGVAKLVTHEDRDSGNCMFAEYFVKCSSCGASGPSGGCFSSGKKLAIDLWNKRPRKPIDKPIAI